jgi:hypothetical protein
VKKKSKRAEQGFDHEFDEGRAVIDFSRAIPTEGLSQVVKLPPIAIPAWLALEIEGLARLQANSKASVVRQLLVEAVRKRKESA